MRKLALTLIPLLLLACNQEPTAPASGPAPSFSATSEWQEVVLSLDWVLYNQCLDEDLHGTGTSFISVHAVTTATETRSNSHARPADDWQLEGLTTHQIWLQVPGGHNEAVQTASGELTTECCRPSPIFERRPSSRFAVRAIMNCGRERT